MIATRYLGAIYLLPSWVAKPRISRFLHSLADQIVRKHRQKDGQSRKKNQPPQIHVLPSPIKQGPPARIGRGGAEPQKREPAFDQDSRSNAKRNGYQHRR